MKSITLKQKKQVARFIKDAAGTAVTEALADLQLDKDALQREVIEKGDELQAALIPVIKQILSQFITERASFCEVSKVSPVKTQYSSSNNPYFDEIFGYWSVFWQDLEIKNPDFTGITPFVYHDGYRPLILPKHELITPQYLYDRCLERFNCRKWHDDSLDKVVTNNDRDPRSGAYVVWFRDRVEADEELKDMSAKMLEKLNIPGITLLERELMEYDHLNHTGGHLDINNLTLCSGSRYDNGFVPSVYWRNDEVVVGWNKTTRHAVRLRSRQHFTF